MTTWMDLRDPTEYSADGDLSWYLVKAERMTEPSAVVVQNLGLTMGRELTLIKAIEPNGIELHLTRVHPTMDPERGEPSLLITDLPETP